MIQCFVRKNEEVREAQPEAIAQAIQEAGTMTWVDMEAPTPEDGEALRQTFGFHHLAIEDCLTPTLSVSKLDDYGTYLFMVVHGVDHNLPPGKLDTHEVDIFIGENYLVTSHIKPSNTISQAKLECVERPSLMAAPDLLAHRIVDSLVDHLLPPIEEEEERLEHLKRAMLSDPRPSQLSAAMDMEENLLNVLRVLEPQSRALRALCLRGEPFVQKSTVAYFSDIQDNLSHLKEKIDILREMADSNLSVYMSVTANRTANFTKALSLVAMVFLPLTLIVGIYGMNFKNMPELEWKYGYFFVLLIILTVGLGLLFLYRKNRWI